jgi:flagellar biosynthetic protein FliQ
MNHETALYFGQSALMEAMMLGGPLLAAALVVGTVISILQAVTQVQEITLVFVPKIIAVFAVIAFLGGWMMERAVGFGVVMFEQIPESGY